MNPALFVVSALVPTVLLLRDRNYGPISQVADVIGSLYHEMGHALTGILLGLQVDRVRVERGRRVEGGYHSSHAVTSMESRGRISDVLVLLAGYTGPVTLACLGMLLMFWTGPVAFSVVWSLLTLVFLRVARGTVTWAVILASAAMALTILIPTEVFPVPWMAGLRYVLPVVLLSALAVTGTKKAGQLVQALRSGQFDMDSDDDATELQRVTYVPRLLWAHFFLAYSLIVAVVAPILIFVRFAT